MQYGLHCADGSFRGRQVKGASMAILTRTSGQVGSSWTQYRPWSLHSIPQFFRSRHEKQIKPWFYLKNIITMCSLFLNYPHFRYKFKFIFRHIPYGHCRVSTVSSVHHVS
jgi:hypothetical protein